MRVDQSGRLIKITKLRYVKARYWYIGRVGGAGNSLWNLKVDGTMAGQSYIDWH